jgi:single-strand DNA-binding protein
MSDLNSYSFAGRLAAAPELKFTQGGTAIWEARVAVGYGYGDNKGTSWITAKALGKRAEAFGKWTLDKGQQVWGCGELQVREFDLKGGGKGKAVEVLIEQFGSAAGGGASATRRPTGADLPIGGGVAEAEDDDLPPF